jgi:pyruvate-formate lyase-activating enzyme
MQVVQKSPSRLPPAVNLYITYHCHSNCSHCFLVQSERINKHQLSKKEIFSIIDELSDHSVFLLIISGGEPLSHPDFFEIVRYADTKNMLPLVAITGTKVSDSDIRNYAAAGIPTVQLSLNAASPLLNDEIRGEGAFAEVLSTINRFKDVGINVNLAICLRQLNLVEIAEFFRLCLTLDVFRVKLGFCREFRSNPRVKELDESQIQAVLGIARNFMQTHGLSRIWIASPTIDIWTGVKILQRASLPPLTIGADGVLTSGDSGIRIGTLGAAPLAMIAWGVGALLVQNRGVRAGEAAHAGLPVAGVPASSYRNPLTLAESCLVFRRTI